MNAITNKTEFDQRVHQALNEFNHIKECEGFEMKGVVNIFDDDYDLRVAIAEKYGVGPHDARREDYPD